VVNSRDHHPIEAIHAMVDGRLDVAEREAVERHIETCADCRAERDVAESTRRIVRQAMPDPGLPAGLAERVGAALDELDGQARSGAAPTGRRVWTWLAPAAAVLIALVALAVLWQRDRDVVPLGDRIVAAVSADFGAVQDGTLPLGRPDAAPAELEAYFAEQGIDFETRVFDLAMMGYELAGGRVQDLAGRPSALFTYRNADGVLMVCRMYLGDLTELPAPARTLEHNGITFHVYERNGRTLVFWEEGDVVCVLASDAPAQAVIDLSFAKAMKV
jgi:anti-sigma factor RsiW